MDFAAIASGLMSGDMSAMVTPDFLSGILVGIISDFKNEQDKEPAALVLRAELTESGQDVVISFYRKSGEGGRLELQRTLYASQITPEMVKPFLKKKK